MCDPRRRIGLPALHERDDSLEVRGGRVAAAQHRQFPAVSIGVVKADVSQHEAHQNQATTMGYEVERLNHRLAVSSRVKNGRGHVTGGDFSKANGCLPSAGDSEIHLELSTTKVQSV